MWIGGQAPSADDKTEFAGIKTAPNAETHPATFAWYVTCSRFNDAVRNSWGAGASKKKGGDDDFDDLFGEDDAAPAKKVEIKKKKKKEVIAMSLVMLEVKPLDSETDLD